MARLSAATAATRSPTNRTLESSRYVSYGEGSGHACPAVVCGTRGTSLDRKSTRLNSSHRCISYAVFCLKKKKQRLDELSQPHRPVAYITRSADTGP